MAKRIGAEKIPKERESGTLREALAATVDRIA